MSKTLPPPDRCATPPAIWHGLCGELQEKQGVASSTKRRSPNWQDSELPLLGNADWGGFTLHHRDLIPLQPSSTVGPRGFVGDRSDRSQDTMSSVKLTLARRGFAQLRRSQGSERGGQPGRRVEPVARRHPVHRRVGERRRVA